ncbi:hypothetical protein LOAG_18750 [Loa loa]|uniref:Uncharacterized protein n=1 Tax=Loa loa TaxID=7209 RepID=A0A1S0UDW8_LOALO|nr:hypothetical protein LOAG_18750 [Loa loa]EJD73860.1 hypothetical protein LOAG_18750 [Loa loa]
MNGHRKSMLTIIFAIFLCVISHYSIANPIKYDELCQQQSPLLLCQFEPNSAKRTNYDFIRFGRSGRVRPATYDYIRFGKRSTEFRINQDFE